MKIAVIVPVMVNWRGCVEMFGSINVGDCAIQPVVIDNSRVNLGVAASWNKGAVEAMRLGVDALMFVNDDVRFLGRGFEYLVESIESTDGICTGYDANRPSFIPKDKPDFAAFGMRNDVFREIGLFDTRFTPAYFEDDDYIYRARLLGKHVGINGMADIEHEGSVTQNSTTNGVCTPGQFRNNMQLYIDKWGGIPGEETVKDKTNAHIPIQM